MSSEVTIYCRRCLLCHSYVPSRIDACNGQHTHNMIFTTLMHTLATSIGQIFDFSSVTYFRSCSPEIFYVSTTCTIVSIGLANAHTDTPAHTQAECERLTSVWRNGASNDCWEFSFQTHFFLGLLCIVSSLVFPNGADALAPVYRILLLMAEPRPCAFRSHVHFSLSSFPLAHRFSAVSCSVRSITSDFSSTITIHTYMDACTQYACIERYADILHSASASFHFASALPLCLCL